MEKLRPWTPACGNKLQVYYDAAACSKALRGIFRATLLVDAARVECGVKLIKSIPVRSSTVFVHLRMVSLDTLL